MRGRRLRIGIGNCSCGQRHRSESPGKQERWSCWRVWFSLAERGCFGSSSVVPALQVLFPRRAQREAGAFKSGLVQALFVRCFQAARRSCHLALVPPPFTDLCRHNHLSRLAVICPSLPLVLEPEFRLSCSSSFHRLPYHPRFTTPSLLIHILSPCPPDHSLYLTHT
jgi:hypothetical protein